MAKIWFVGLILLTSLAAWSGSSCTPPVGSASNAKIFLNITNDTGCNVVATLDGSGPVTNSSNGGPYTLFTNVKIGHHTIGINAFTNSACNFDINGGNQTCNLDHPCDAGFFLSCN